MRVLVTEANANWRYVLEQHLRRRGHDVILAATLEETLAYLDRHEPPQLIIVDVDPDTSAGKLFCQRLRDRPGVEAINILRRESEAANGATANDGPHSLSPPYEGGGRGRWRARRARLSLSHGPAGIGAGEITGRSAP